jgi:uncharacterized protein with NRDE domain
MCLLLIAKKVHPDYKLVICANRDEFYERPSMPANFWNDHPKVLAGKDLKAGGTWLGINREGKLAAITNFRGGLKERNNAPTRGMLTADYLISNQNPVDYLKQIIQKANDYNGFNLVVGGVDNLYYLSNREGTIRKLENEIYGLSDGVLDSNWPKVLESKAKFEEVIKKKFISTEDLFDILSDRSTAEDQLLPNTGIDMIIEKTLSAVFIKTEKYGTRCSTVITVDRNNKTLFIERTFNNISDGYTEVSYNFQTE